MTIHWKALDGIHCISIFPLFSLLENLTVLDLARPKTFRGSRETGLKAQHHQAPALTAFTSEIIIALSFQMLGGNGLVGCGLHS